MTRERDSRDVVFGGAMKIYVVLNMRSTAMGLLGKAIAEAGGEVQHCAAYSSEELIRSPDGFDALIVMGGEQNALNDADFRCFPELLTLIRAFEAEDKAVLGICLGSQLVARAFGGKNQVGGASEFAWSEITLVNSSGYDPVVAALPPAFRQFQWHDDTFTLPPSAIRLAGSKAAENQMFRVGRACYGLQFHTEVGIDLAAEWCAMYRDILLEKDPDWLDHAASEARLHGPGAQNVSNDLLKAWLDLVKR